MPIPSLPIDSRHVSLQFDRKNPQDVAFFYDEIAQRMMDRLAYIKLTPQRILDAGCGIGNRVFSLQQRYPKAQITGVDSNAQRIQTAQRDHKPSGFTKFFKPKETADFIQADLAKTHLPPQSFELVWSNLALHWHPNPHQVLAEWYRILHTGGLAFFSYFAPTSLQEVRQAVVQSGLHTQTLPFVDMHDIGDLLLEQGFSDPVMDQEIITLTYQTPQTLLADVQALGGNANPHRRAGLVGRKTYQRLCQALEAQRHDDGLLHLTLEVAYGHAWRSASFQQGQETFVSFDSLKQSLPSQRA